jgi:hypothetical protein
MILTLTSMNLYEQITALLLGNALHYDTIGTMPVEIPFYQRVFFSQMSNPISGSHVIGKDVVFQVGLDLRDSCIGTSLSFWILRVGMHGASRDAYNP